MKLFLRPHRDDDAPGRQPNAGNDKDYVVIDGTPIGRIYADRLQSGEKWLWFLHMLRASPNTVRTQTCTSVFLCRDS
jgi:hypothetical protein